MKNTMSLENYGVVPMTTREMETTNGGGPLVIIAIVAGLLAAYKIGYTRGKQSTSGSGGGGGESAYAL